MIESKTYPRDSLKKVDDLILIEKLNQDVSLALSKIQFVRIPYNSHYMYDDGLCLYSDENGYYEILYLEHGEKQIQYMGKKTEDVVYCIVRRTIVSYAISEYEPNKNRSSSVRIKKTDWSLINAFISHCYEYIFPNEKPPVLPKDLLQVMGSVAL